MQKHRNRLPTVVLAIVTLACTGCGNGGPKPIPVEGHVTLAGGVWPAPGTLNFVPIKTEDGVPLRSGTADFEIDGAFKATTYRPGDGLLPGHYRVRVVCWKVAPSMANPAGESYVAPKFQNPATSGLELYVPPDKTSCTAEFLVTP